MQGKNKISFTKMHAAGNDFIVIDETSKITVPEGDKPCFVEKACKRHFGVGADGAIFIQKSSVCDLKFHFFNPDGTNAEMCGNGIRCLAKYARENGLTGKDEMMVETLAGNLTIRMAVEDGKMISSTVDMGAPRMKNKEIPVEGDPDKMSVEREIEAKGEKYEITAVSMGNPHAVIFTEDVDSLDVKKHGANIRYSNTFPNGANAHFVEKTGENQFRIRTYERGVEDETLACGTGICASAVAAILTGKADAGENILFHSLGGDLSIKVETENQIPLRVLMSGDAETVFTGQIIL